MSDKLIINKETGGLLLALISEEEVRVVECPEPVEGLFFNLDVQIFV